MSVLASPTPPSARLTPTGDGTAVRVERVTHRFGAATVLDRVSFSVDHGQVHALLGPNGAGKTTLLRVLSGLVEPTEGHVEVAGAVGSQRMKREVRARLGFVPSGSRTFYMRLSGRENLVFFGRLHGLRRAGARQVAGERLDAVGLADHADRQVGIYSHGMQKRLSVARGLLLRPDVLLVDEATHDLDPPGASQIRELISAAARSGTAVLWATQRVEEIRGFADTVTVLQDGGVRFDGAVPTLMATSSARLFLLRLASPDSTTHRTAEQTLSGIATVERSGGGDDHLLIRVADDALLGDAIAALSSAGVAVAGCTEARSEIERAFFALTRRGPTGDDAR